MNGGLEMLMARMDTHPEEFTAEVKYGASKWSDLVQQFKHCLPEEDMKAFTTKLNEVQAQHFTELVMEELVDPKSQKDKWGDTVLAGQTHAQSMAIQQAYLAQQAQATQAHIQLHQQAAQQSGLLGSTGQSLLRNIFGGSK